MQLQLITAPALPLSLAELKTHLVVDADFSDDDPLINGQAQAAMDQVENFTRRALMTQTWQLNLDRFPGLREPIFLPRPPLQTVTSITYIDCNGVVQILTSSNYKVDAISEPARVVPVFEECWPDTREEIAAVTVTYDAGYPDAASVPDAIKQALLLLLGSMYRDREDSAPVNLNPIPESARRLLYPIQVGNFGW